MQRGTRWRTQRVLAAVLSIALIQCQLPLAAWAQEADSAPRAAASAPAETDASDTSADDTPAPDTDAPDTSADDTPAPDTDAPAATDDAASSATDSAAPDTSDGTGSAPAEGDDVELSLTIQVIGPDASGNICRWMPETDIEAKPGQTVIQITKEQFAAAGLAATFRMADAGDMLDAITSPIDGRVLADDARTGYAWTLFVDGVRAPLGDTAEMLADGSEIVWYYCAGDAALPSADQIVADPSLEKPDPSAPRQKEDSFWPGFDRGMQGAVADVSTPRTASGTELAWDPIHLGMGTSDPVIVGDTIYMYASGMLSAIDSETGEMLAQKRISTKPGYFCRPVYAEGLLIVPLDDGRLMAYTLFDAQKPEDSLRLVWETPRIVGYGSPQALSSLTVSGGRVFAAFTVVDWANPLKGTGIMVSASLADGSCWQQVCCADEFYWAGAAAAGDALVIADEQGRVMLIDSATGAVLSQICLGCASHASVARVTPTRFAVVTTDGQLHLVGLKEGKLSLLGSVKFADHSTSTPVIRGRYAFVGGGRAQEGSRTLLGTISAIDLTRVVCDHGCYQPDTVIVGEGQVQATPLVVSYGDHGAARVYVTCNARPGSLYAASFDGAALHAASAIFTPSETAQQNWCTASPVAGPDGKIFYTNDSGYLFALRRAPYWTIVFDVPGAGPISRIDAPAGRGAGLLPVPSRPGYIFCGWYLDAGCTEPFDPSQTESAGATLVLHAKWEPKQEPKQEPQQEPKQEPKQEPTGARRPLVPPARRQPASDTDAAQPAQTAKQDKGLVPSPPSVQRSVMSSGLSDMRYLIVVPLALPLVGFAVALALFGVSLHRRNEE